MWKPFTFSHLSALADRDGDIHAIQIIKSASTAQTLHTCCQAHLGADVILRLRLLEVAIIQMQPFNSWHKALDY